MKKLMTIVSMVGLFLMSGNTFASNSETMVSTSTETEVTNKSENQTTLQSETQTITHTDIVYAHSSDRYSQTLRAGVKYYIYLSGDGDTDLDLYLYDENGNLIDSDYDNTDECLCIVTPRWTGRFTIKVVNRGSVYNRYTIRII